MFYFSGLDPILKVINGLSTITTLLIFLQNKQYNLELLKIHHEDVISRIDLEKHKFSYKIKSKNQGVFYINIYGNYSI